MIGRILVPLDGSRLAEEVLPFVEELAWRLRTEVCFLRVVDEEWPKGVLEAGSWESGLPSPSVVQEEEARSYLSVVAERWQKKDIRTTTAVVAGLPATAIIEYAHTHRVDLIAMCTHGRSGFGRLVFGSVADQVLREAGMPVLLFKPEHVVERMMDRPAA